MIGWLYANIPDAARWTGAARSLGRRLDNPRLYVAWAGVLLLHLVVVWILLMNISPPRVATDQEREIVTTTFVAPKARVVPAFEPIPEPTMQAPDATGEVSPPEIEVQGAPVAAAGPTTADILPPRPDPAHQNTYPQLPPGSAPNSSSVQVLLTILVAPDGSVADARVAQSSGESAADQIAAAFVKTRWRFRAAMLGGRPVSDWTTVLVRFQPTG